MKMRVSEAAQYTGLENDTLRYYETMGIVSPHRDPESGYRIYDDWDLHFLTDTKWYRSLGLSLSDVTGIVRSDALKELTDKCERQSSALLQKINDCQDKLMVIHKHLERIQRIPFNLGVFTHSVSPSIVYQRNELDPDPEFIAKLQCWKELFPHVSHTFAISVDELRDLSPESEPYFGFSLTAQDAVKYRIKPESPAQYFPSQQCLYTIFEARGPGTFIHSFRAQVLEPLRERGQTVYGPVWGNLIVRCHEHEELHRFFEVWLPVSL